MHHSTAELLDGYARRMELPIVGVRLGLKDDRSTWSIQFSDDATQNDRDKEAETIANFDEEAESALIEILASETSYTAAQLRELMKTEMTA